jgi:hypothetical protein
MAKDRDDLIKQQLLRQLDAEKRKLYSTPSAAEPAAQAAQRAPVWNDSNARD